MRPGLEHQPAVQIAGGIQHDLGICLGIGRGLVSAVVGHAQAPAEIDEFDCMVRIAQLFDKLAQQREGALEGFEIGDLTADMHVHATSRQARQLVGQTIEFERFIPGNAKFVVRLAGGDFVVRLRIDVGIDAKRDTRGLAELARDRAQCFEFGRDSTLNA